MVESELSKLTIGSLLEQQAGSFPERECIAYPDLPLRLTYRQFNDRVDLVARGLMTLGIRKAEHVALWAANVPEWLYLQYATAKLGAILVGIHPSCDADELERVLRNSETTTLLLGAGVEGRNNVELLRSLLPDLDEAPVGHARFEKLPRLQRLLFIGRRRLPGMLRFDDLYDLAAQTHPVDYRRRCEALASYEVINLR